VSATLEIRDGNPDWYLSSDIWVVPGTDPTAPAGRPVAGQSAYVWAHVHNLGDNDALGGRVDFYWANPALQVLRSNTTIIGSSNVDLPAGGAQDVLCLAPWVPSVVNGGHECLVAVVNHPNDPLPTPPPNDFNPPAYHQVAQKNLTVLPAGAHAAQLILTVFGLARASKEVRVVAAVGGELDGLSLARLGLKGYAATSDDAVEVGLDSRRRCVGSSDPIGSKQLELRVERGTSAAVHLSVRAEGLAKDEYQLVRVTEQSGDSLLGGFAAVVVRDRKEKPR
jgi:hypothetical protein